MDKFCSKLQALQSFFVWACTIIQNYSWRLENKKERSYSTNIDMYFDPHLAIKERNCLVSLMLMGA